MFFMCEKCELLGAVARLPLLASKIAFKDPSLLVFTFLYSLASPCTG